METTAQRLQTEAIVQPTEITPDKKVIAKTVVRKPAPVRHFISSPSASPVTPRNLVNKTEASDSEAETDDEDKNSQEWPVFPSFLEKDIRDCDFETLIYMLAGANYNSVFCDQVRHAVSKFWENERKLKSYDEKRLPFESKRVQKRLTNRSDLIESLKSELCLNKVV
jgi:hypothetical protein